MERFYTHLRAGMGKAEALRQAQLDVRATYPAPYYWAGFVLSGDEGTVRTDLPWWGIGATIASVAALIAIAGVFVLRRRQRAAARRTQGRPEGTAALLGQTPPPMSDDLLAALLATVSDHARAQAE